ncbi:MAG: hypothetical protein KGJ43_07355, partial [Acidobacteriota bacterium]|nr:hypothetical protein [Acidobacteriota bacterium]
MAPSQLFVFVQIEVDSAPGPPDGRYVVRSGASEKPGHVLVLRRAGDRGFQATVIDAVPLAAEQQARAWLAGPTPRLAGEAA